MSLAYILIISAACLIGGRLLPLKIKRWFIFCVSILGLFIFQPVLPIHNLSFWLSIAAITLTIFVWAITQGERIRAYRSTNLTGVILIVSMILIIAVWRYITPLSRITPERPPPISLIIIALLGIAGFAYGLSYLAKKRIAIWFFFVIIILIFAILKYPWLTEQASIILRRINRQDIQLASSFDLYWIGYSYLAFRLLHVLRDFQSGRLPHLSLSDFICYALFLPSYIAGPIDRSQRFIKELDQATLTAAHDQGETILTIIEGGKRIITGIIKKFVLADTLSLIALNAHNALEIKTSFWAWVVLYAYTMRIYFDFSGYTDIALGMSKILGINLPENFDAPYLKTNLISFWNSWHITLAQWFRAYFFNPYTRFMRLNFVRMPPWSIILSGQLFTMLLIGLWHGFTWNFALWGAWHGVGLFVNNRLSEWTKRHPSNFYLKPYSQYLSPFLGWLMTFNFVALGWVWFILPNPTISLKFFQLLIAHF